jgi:hypothetical protein
MGSIIGKIYEDYSTYTEMCDITNVPPVDIHNTGKWYQQMREMFEEAGVKSETEWFQKMKDRKIFKLK